MAVPFYLPEGGTDDIAPSSSGNSGASASTSSSSASSSSGSSSGSSSSSGASDGASSIASQSPNTTNSATQTPMQSPLSMPTDQVLIALCEWYQQHQRHYNANHTAPQIFQYPLPPSPSCSMAQSPSYTGGDVFFAHGAPLHPMPRTPRTSVSFAAGEELNFFRQPYPAPSTPQPQPMPPQPPAPQSAPPLHYSHSYPQQSTHYLQHLPSSSSSYGHPMPAGAYYATYTPPPTPNTVHVATSTSAAAAAAASVATSPFATRYGIHGPALASTPLAPHGSKMRLQRSHSDAARRKRLTSTGEDEREYQSDHETSWDEFDERFDNFTAGRERLQEFNGRIPPRKKKSNNNSSSSSSNSSNGNNNNASNQYTTTNGAAGTNDANDAVANKSKCNSTQRAQTEEQQKKQQQSFTWPTVVTVFVLAMGCGFFAAR